MVDRSDNAPVTALLHEMKEGSALATARLWSLVYDELRALAHQFLKHEHRDHVLQTTVLVHEVYLKIVGQTAIDWRDRAHFFGVAAQAIRRILVDWVRSERTLKRGRDMRKVALLDEDLLCEAQQIDVVGLSDALERLTALNERWGRVVELRFFAGLTIPEVAQVLGASQRTINGDWEFARAWLRREIVRDE